MQRSRLRVPALMVGALCLAAAGTVGQAAAVGHPAPAVVASPGLGPGGAGSGAESDPRAPVAPPVLVPVGLGSLDQTPTGEGGSAPPANPPSSGSASAVPGQSGASDTPTPSSPVSPPASPLNPTTIGAPLDPDAVEAALAPLLTGGALGPGRSPAHVIDVATGEVLYSAVDEPTVPASTIKLVTAASVLDAVGPDTRLRTRVVVVDPAASTPRVILVGAGDPSLRSTGTKVGRAGTSLTPASLEELAGATARALAVRGITRAKVGYDASAFTGPDMHPSWARSFPAAGIIAPVSALVVDQGRRAPRGVARVPDPAARAGQVFAEQLTAAGIAVRGGPKEVEVPDGAETLASVESPPVGVLVERMLSVSDNDYAEILGRLGAAAAGEPASFAGVSDRAAQVLRDLGVDAEGARFADASGLSRRNRLAPSTLTELLAATSAGYGSMHSGLPVAGATGSLAARFRPSDQRAARGVVRAKTGTLTGVGALAGYASRPDGRLLALAFVDGSTPGGALAARVAFDRAVATLVSCDCAAGP